MWGCVMYLTIASANLRNKGFITITAAINMFHVSIFSNIEVIIERKK